MVSFSADFETFSLEMIENMSRPRILKTHLPAFLLPKELWTINPKVFFLISVELKLFYKVNF